MSECDCYKIKKTALYFLTQMTQEEFDELMKENIKTTTTPREPHQFNMIKYFEDIGMKK